MMKKKNEIKKSRWKVEIVKCMGIPWKLVFKVRRNRSSVWPWHFGFNPFINYISLYANVTVHCVFPPTVFVQLQKMYTLLELLVWYTNSIHRPQVVLLWIKLSTTHKHLLILFKVSMTIPLWIYYLKLSFWHLPAKGYWWQKIFSQWEIF